MYYIDKTMKPRRIRLFLYTPTRKQLGEIYGATNKQQSIKFSNVNTLSFSIPYDVMINHQSQRNPIIDKVRERYLVKAVLGDIEEWYIITKKEPVSDGTSDLLTIQCYALEYELTYKKLLNYTQTSYNCLQVLTDVLTNTNWSVGYINSDFNLTWRSFDVSSQTKLDFIINDLCTTFNAVIQFDTVNRVVNVYKEDEISNYKGFWIEYGKYLQSVDQTVDIDSVVTRLYVTSNSSSSTDVSINSVNPTGQSYIDNFSYYLYPFERDDNKNIITSSYYMTDELCQGLLDYNELVDANEDDFQNFLSQQTQYQDDLTQLNTDLDTMKTDLQTILDDIQVAKTAGNPTTDLINQRNAKQQDIANQKVLISNKQSQIDEVTNGINQLNDLLDLKTNLGNDLYSELIDYIFVDEYSDNNQTNDLDLYNSSVNYLSTVCLPPINLSLGIVNFFEIVKEQYNWDRFGIGDIIRVKYDKLNIDVKTKITEIDVDYENATISLTISNTSRPDSIEKKLTNAFYTLNKMNKDYMARKVNWDAVATNFNTQNDRIKTVPNDPTISLNPISHTSNDDGSVNLTFAWSYNDYTKTKNEADNIDGFLVYLYSDPSSDTYVFGSQLAKESLNDITSDLRQFTFTSAPSNLYYTLGVRAYRRVDDDINPDGIILSDIITSDTIGQNPYLPSSTVNINGNVNGKVNGVTTTVDDMAPINPDINDVWIDTTTHQTKIWDGTQWNVSNASNSTTVNGYQASITSAPNTIPVSNSDGNLEVSITGDAQSVQGKQVGTTNGIASLDGNLQVPITQLNNSTFHATGSYVGDGATSKSIILTFTPSTVKIYTTDATDSSLWITSTGGMAYSSNNTLVGSPSSIYGSITTNSFQTGSTTDAYGNKAGITYYWEAIKSANFN